MKKLLFWSLLLLLVVGSLLPVAYLPPPVFSIWDKLQHATGFAVLCLLGLKAYESHRTRVFVGLLVLGALIEIAQTATGWRFGDWFDLVADGVGIGVALTLSTSWPLLRARTG